MSAPESLDPSAQSHNTNIAIGVVVFISVALYNSLELIVHVLLGFNRRRSLYFWSLFLSTILGIIPTSIAISFELFDYAPL